VLALFDSVNDASLELLRSLRRARVPFAPVFIHYGGSLPSGALCPFTSYTGLPREGRPLFFNEVPVPEWCEIRQGKEAFGEVLREGMRIGRINYGPNSFREVESVDWLLADHTPSHTEHYDRYGNRYATSYYRDGEVYQTVYRGPGEWEIEVRPGSRVITKHSPRARLSFSSLTEFVIHFLEDQQIDSSRAIINSLSVPLFVMRRLARRPAGQPAGPPAATLFWQERLPAETPGNLAAELSAPVALERVVFGTEALLHEARTRHPESAVEFSYLSQLDRFAEKPRFDPTRTFTLTSTDRLPGLERLLAALPHVTFVVAATTTMSERLHALGRRFSNLRLMPGITHAEIREQLEQASIYLDINTGPHVLEVVRAAFHLNLLVLALDDRAKAPDYSLSFADVPALREALAAISREPLERSRALEALHRRNGPQSTPGDYRHLLGVQDRMRENGGLSVPESVPLMVMEGPGDSGH